MKGDAERKGPLLDGTAAASLAVNHLSSGEPLAFRQQNTLRIL